MNQNLPRSQKATLFFGAAIATFLCLPYPTQAQSSAPQNQQAVQSDTQQDRQAAQNDADRRDNDAVSRDNGVGRRDVANFDQFLDSHREIAEQVRRDPSLLDNRTFVQNHPALQTYLQNNPGVRDQLRQNPNAFMHQENAYDRDTSMRDRDANVNRDANLDRDAGVNRNANVNRDGNVNRDADHRDVANFDRFLDQHREIAEQVRKDPSQLDNRTFVQNHPALQAYLQDNPGVRDQLRQNPNAFMQQQETYDRNSNVRDRDPMHDHMAEFGGFLNNHSDIQKDLSRNPANVKDHQYVQNHAQLDAYLNAHPDARAELMANPQSFVHGAMQYNASPSGTSNGAGVTTGRGTSTTGASNGTTGTSTGATGTSTNPTTTHEPNPVTTTHAPSKPNQ